MNLLELVFNGSLVFDAVGVAGLGLLALAAIRLARREQSWGGNLMAIGAVSLLLGRLFIMLSSRFVTRDLLAKLGPPYVSANMALPVVLLSLGLAGVVWGLWGHSRWLQERR